ncbi:hypothetical protein KKB40_02090, partial [Patescibacteria group bacterium]|nr:hypothetical protein [Patescibacteria group bacterium]
MFSEAKWVKIIHKHISHPWFLYPENENNFFKIRDRISQIRITGSSPNKHNLLHKKQAYINLYQDKKVEHIMLKQTLEDFFDLVENVLGKTEKDKLVSETLKKLSKQHSVNIYVMDKLFTPFSTYITDRQVLIPLFFVNKKHRLLIMQGEEIIKTYRDYFEEYKKEGQEILCFNQPI